jgi:iron(III) transport system permease protein
MRSVLVGAFVLLAILCIIPVLYVVADSFLSAEGGLTFKHYITVFAPAYRLGVLWTSLKLAFLATLLATLIGLPYAFFSTRVKTPGRAIFSSLYILPLVLPPLLMTMGWTQFLYPAGENPTAEGFTRALGGVPGAAFLFGLSYFPFVVLFARKGFLEIGAGLEEAARVSVGPFRAFLRVTLPLAAPGILAGMLFVFLFSISDFSVVDYLSTIFPVRERVNAYTFEAFSAFSTNYQQQAGRREAAALCAPVAVFSIGLLILIALLLRKGSYSTVTSGHRRPRDIEDGASPTTKFMLRAGGFLLLTGVLLLSVGVPLRQTVLDAIGRNHDLIGNLKRSMAPATDGGLPDLLNSLMYSGLAALLMVLLATVIGHHAARRGPRREALVFCLAFLPLAFGPILFGSGLIRTWNHTWLENANRHNLIYDTWGIVVLMMAGKYLPFALAAVMTSVKRLDRRYEEVAAVAGAGGLRRMLSVVSPLTAKGIAAGFVLGFVFSLRELDTIVLIQSGNRTAMMKIYTWVHTAYEANVASLSLVLMLTIALPLIIYSLVTARRMSVV